ncbi:MAG: DUF481 domain-containing protein [Bacteroidetes bacterium]|nr:MAG: DUF481 domain-containing protein [Bacteroidota bacterium]
MFCMKEFWLTIVLILFVFGINAAKAESSKIDTVYFRHGDRLTGELVSLNKGILKLKTNDVGTVSIEWQNVDSLCILNPLRILKHNGGILYGRLYPSGKNKVGILVDAQGDKSEIELVSIVELIQLKEKILSRLSGTLSTGFNYTRATEVSQLNFTGNLDYKGEKTIFSANYDIVLTDDGTETTQRQTGAASFNRILPKNWSVVGKILAESNSEFKLDVRTSVITAGSYYFIRSNSQILQAGAGFSVNREFSGELAQNNIEGIIGLGYSLFIIDSPEVTYNFAGYLFPGLNRFGRVRSEINTDLKWEIFSDFFLKGSLYFSFDNEPLSGVDTHTDWGTSLGVEYKF